MIFNDCDWPCNLDFIMLSNTNVINSFTYDHYCYLYHHRNDRYLNLLNILIIIQGQPSSQPSTQPTSQPSRQPTGMTYIYDTIRIITDMNTLMILSVVPISFFIIDIAMVSYHHIHKNLDQPWCGLVHYGRLLWWWSVLLLSIS